MKLKFSDRIGITSPPKFLQLEEMTNPLRNSLWNFLLNNFFQFERGLYLKSANLIGEKFLKIPIDEIPYIYGKCRDWFKNIFYKMEWYEVYNLIDFLAEYCYDICGFNKIKFRLEINQILKEEMSGYQFINDLLVPITNQEEIESITSCIKKATEHDFLGVKQHIETAISLLSQKPNPDYRNSIKESISALESLVKQISGEETGGLEKALSKLDAKIQFHGAFKSGLLKLYGYTSNEDGIRHPILAEPSVGFDEAKFMLIICSAIINFLISKSSICGLI